MSGDEEKRNDKSTEVRANPGLDVTRNDEEHFM